jgi:hypothetical protein
MFANIFQRETIEAIYPCDVFENDAGLNSTADAATLHGVFIGSAPDNQGEFRIARATRQVGEAPHESGSLFLCPYMGQAYGAFSLQGGSKGAVVENRDIMVTPPRGIHRLHRRTDPSRAEPCRADCAVRRGA